MDVKNEIDNSYYYLPFKSKWIKCQIFHLKLALRWFKFRTAKECGNWNLKTDSQHHNCGSLSTIWKMPRIRWFVDSSSLPRKRRLEKKRSSCRVVSNPSVADKYPLPRPVFSTWLNPLKPLWFQSRSTTFSVQFYSTFGALSEQVQSKFLPISEQFYIRFRAVSEQF